VAPLFDALRRTSCSLGIVSNTEAVLTRFDLDRFALLTSVDAMVLSSEAGVRKPDPRIFQIALGRLHAAAKGTVFVGNSIAEDIDGARRAGLSAIYLDDAAAGVERLGGDCSALRVTPTEEALTRALHMLGCRLPSSPSPRPTSPS
jgi:putative hydrolase of the HAD superfamily